MKIQTIDYSWGEVEIAMRPINRLYPTEMPLMRKHEFHADLDIEPDDIDLEDTLTVIWEIAEE